MFWLVLAKQGLVPSLITPGRGLRWGGRPHRICVAFVRPWPIRAGVVYVNPEFYDYFAQNQILYHHTSPYITSIYNQYSSTESSYFVVENSSKASVNKTNTILKQRLFIQRS
jgi:hypothetical protein